MGLKGGSKRLRDAILFPNPVYGMYAARTQAGIDGVKLLVI